MSCSLFGLGAVKLRPMLTWQQPLRAEANMRSIYAAAGGRQNLFHLSHGQLEVSCFKQCRALDFLMSSNNCLWSWGHQCCLAPAPGAQVGQEVDQHYYEVWTIRVLAVGPTTPFLGALHLRAHNQAPRVAPPVGRRPRNCAHTSWRVSSTVLFKVVICDEDSCAGRPLRLCGSRGEGGW